MISKLALVFAAGAFVGGDAFRLDPKANKTVQSSAAVAAIDAVEQAMHKLTDNPHMNPEMLAAAKKVSQEVDDAAKQIESGKGSMALVAHAIGDLQGLQAKFESSAKDALAKEKAAEAKEKSAADRIAELKKKLEEKKALLAQDENMLEAAKMQKDMLEKAEKAEGGAKEDQRQQQQELASLEAMAKSMQAPDKNHTEVHSKVPKSLEHVVADLKARAANITSALARLDSDEKAREAEMEKFVGDKVPTTGKKDAIQQGQKMLTMLKKQARRSYKKARAVKAAELNELTEAIGSIEKGDVKALTKLMGKMEHETKQMSAKSKNFLY
jgi:chromosome segregation ATPase